MKIFIHTNGGGSYPVTLYVAKTIEDAANYILSQKWIKTDHGIIVFVHNISFIAVDF